MVILRQPQTTLASGVHGRSYRSLLLCVSALCSFLQAKRLTVHQLPRHSSHNLLHNKCHPIQSLILWQYLSDWLGLCYWYRFCDYHLCLYIGWSLQSSRHNLLRCMAGLPLEKSPSLYILSNIWSIHGRNVAYGHVLVRISECSFPIWNSNST